jgi:hypothetical protein
MFATQEYQRRLASLMRAEAGRAGVPVRTPFATVALARRLSAIRSRDVAGAVDPVTASVPDSRPLLLRS